MNKCAENITKVITKRRLRPGQCRWKSVQVISCEIKLSEGFGACVVHNQLFVHHEKLANSLSANSNHQYRQIKRSVSKEDFYGNKFASAAPAGTRRAVPAGAPNPASRFTAALAHFPTGKTGAKTAASTLYRSSKLRLAAFMTEGGLAAVVAAAAKTRGIGCKGDLVRVFLFRSHVATRRKFSRHTPNP